jgi:hypothetical protein
VQACSSKGELLTLIQQAFCGFFMRIGVVGQMKCMSRYAMD